MYVRNFRPGFGLAWQTVFQTGDRATVEEYCRERGHRDRVAGRGRLRARAVRPAVVRHPRTGEPIWFNHAHLLPRLDARAAGAQALLAEFAEEDLPSNTYYGDGSPIEPEVLDALREAYRAESVTFPWKRGDVLILDNMLTAHARAPYSGPRKILVGMAEPVDRLSVTG